MTARFSRWKLALALLGSAGFVAVSIWMIGSPEFPGMIVKTFSALGIAFFGAVALYAVWSLFDRRPVLIINKDSVFDRRSMDRAIPWSEVLAVSSLTIRKREFFYIDIGQPADRYTDHPLKVWLLNLNQGFAPGVVISPYFLDSKPEVVRNAVERFSPEL